MLFASSPVGSNLFLLPLLVVLTPDRSGCGATAPVADPHLPPCTNLPRGKVPLRAAVVAWRLFCTVGTRLRRAGGRTKRWPLSPCRIGSDGPSSCEGWNGAGARSGEYCGLGIVGAVLGVAPARCSASLGLARPRMKILLYQLQKPRVHTLEPEDGDDDVTPLVAFSDPGHGIGRDSGDSGMAPSVNMS